MNKTWKAMCEATHVQEINFMAKYSEHRESVQAAGGRIPKYTALEWIRSNPVIPTTPSLTDKTA